MRNKERSELSKRTQAAIRIAKNAGEALLPVVGDRILAKKGVSNVLTSGDQRSNTVIRRMIHRNFPGEQFLSEEGKQKIMNPLEEQQLWIVDPLDGSKNQADNLPIVCVSIAYAEKGEVKVGVIYNPYTNQLYYAEKGKGAWYEGPRFVGSKEMIRERLSVSTQTSLSKASAETSISYNADETINHNLILLGLYLNGVTPRVRQIGSSVEQLARVTRGQSDLHFHSGLKPWDYAAGTLLIQEAGGVSRGLDGRTTTFMDPDNVSGNKELVEQFIAEVKKIPGNQDLIRKVAARIEQFKV